MSKQNNSTYIIQCPVCNSSDFNFVLNAFTKPDKVDFFKEIDQKFIECNHCGTTLKAPLEVTKQDIEEYGKVYYDQIGSNQNQMNETIKRHIATTQVSNYKTFERFIKEHYPANQFKHWLDVGSAGSPTVFEDYDFITIEPDPRTVSIGKELFNGDKIYCSVLDNFQQEEKFDGLVFHHSFYCLPNPNESLQKAASLLKDDAVLVIAIGQFYMETSAIFNDNKFSRLEDIYRGETYNVYYNKHSIEYIAQKNGFELEHSTILQHQSYEKNGHYSSHYFAFRKKKDVALNDTLLIQSKNFVTERLTSTLNEWEEETKETLKEFNNEKSVFIGDFKLFSTLNEISPLDNIAGFIDFDLNYEANYSLNGISHIPLKKELLEDKNIIMCSFHKQRAITETLENLNLKNIYVPKRQSRIENMFFTYHKKAYYTKAFSLRLVENS